VDAGGNQIEHALNLAVEHSRRADSCEEQCEAGGRGEDKG
jgi:hypothetical protein